MKKGRPDASGGSTAEVKLLRPNTWFESENIHQVGDSTWLDISDMNLSGTAVAQAFTTTRLDTRSAEARALLAQGYYPVLSTFKHKSDEVLYLRFTNGDKIGTTAPHPFWSIDRDGWIAAKDLQKGEHVKTSTGFAVIDSSVIVPIPTEVYNLESWRVHNYVVGDVGVEVYNDCDWVNALNAYLKKEFNLPRVPIIKVSPKDLTNKGLGKAQRIGNEIILPDNRKIKVSLFELPRFESFTLKIGSKPMSFKCMTKLSDNVDFQDANRLLAKELENSGIKLVKPASIATLKGDKAGNYSNVTFEINGKEVTYTWHHHEDGDTMMLVEQYAHQFVGHSGGSSLKNLLGVDFLRIFFSNPVY